MKLNNFFLRALTSAVYVGLIFGTLFAGAASFGLFCTVLYVTSTDEYMKLMKRMKVRMNGSLLHIFGLLVLGLTIMNRIWQVDDRYMILIMPAILVLIVTEFLRNSKNPIYSTMASVFGLIYLALPMASLFLIGFFNQYAWVSEFQASMLIGFFLLIWANDTGAYLLGSAIGKTKLIERISPKKTVEGSLGGLLLAGFGAWVVSLFATQVSLLDWIVISILIVIFGSLGDLFESLLKRKAEVKDSGKIVPGHGGILDRLDSILFAAPAVCSYLALIAH